MLNFPRWKQLTIIAICLAGIFVVLPNFLSQQTLNRWPTWLPKWELSLGLDLRGGAHLLYAMETDDVRNDWLLSLRDAARQRLRDAKIPVSGLGIGNNAVQVRLAKAGDADAALKALEQIPQQLGNPMMGTTRADVEVIQGNKGAFTIRPTDFGLNQRISSAIQAAIETVRRRVDLIGTKEPYIAREGADRILVQVPGLQDTAELERLIGETARLSFHQVHNTMTPAEARAGRIPIGYKIYQGTDRSEGELLLRERPVVKGEELVDARPGFHPQNNQPIVEFRFNNLGARKFGRFTRQHIDKPFAIVLDDKVISAPVIRSAIEGGAGYIEGSFTPESSTKLAIQLKSGALPAKLTIAEKRTVGPSLGSDSISAGTTAGIVGAIAVVGLTILYYGTFGIFACIGLIMHGILTVAILSMFGAALTLPGIAGLVLGIGMAVDANVLVYERIREEVRGGKSPISAIDNGFSRAFVTIADSQLTTLCCALVMFWLGAGPIRGFAVTLTIGIGTSIFASLTVVRLLVYYWLNAQPRVRGKALALPV